MALNIGQDFKKRWLDTPEPVRQVYEDDLKRICELLRPETSIQNWQAREQRAQLESHQRIETAYAELKAELLEQARIRKQRALEKSLAKNALTRLLIMPGYMKMKLISFINRLSSCIF